MSLNIIEGLTTFGRVSGKYCVEFPNRDDLTIVVKWCHSFNGLVLVGVYDEENARFIDLKDWREFEAKAEQEIAELNELI